ncbi:hypothetical protein Droror1_Dr00006635 [Drosera rotundifolia]
MQPDLAQKLLTDLRLRKERMAASQSSGRQSIVAAAAYGRKKVQGFLEAIDMTRNIQNGYTGSHRRSPMTAEASNQIVPYRKDRSSQPIDLSTALSLTFNQRSSATKPGIISIEWPSNTRYPTLTHIQIKEIANRVQTLNQVLRTCSSNALRINGRSIEIGTKLMKGALDLEESLRMLVSLQETAEYMGSSTRKSQIKLLEDGEGGKDDISKLDKKNVSPPVFSFDKNQEKQVVANPGGSLHLRTASASSDRGIHKSSAISKHEAGRRSNIVAKLMGLEDLPPSTTQEIKKGRQAVMHDRVNDLVSTSGSSKRSEFRIEEDDREIQVSKMAIVASYGQQKHKEILMLPFHEHYDNAPNDRKARWPEVDGDDNKITHAVKDDGSPMLRAHEQKTSRMKANQKGEKRRTMRLETKTDTIKQEDQKSKENGKTKEIVEKHKLLRTELEAKHSNKEEKQGIRRDSGTSTYHNEKAKELKFHNTENKKQHAEYNKSQDRNLKGAKTVGNDSSGIMEKLKKLQRSKPRAMETRTKNKNGIEKHEVLAAQRRIFTVELDNVGNSDMSSTNLVDATKPKKENNDSSEVQEDECRIVEAKKAISMEVKSAKTPLAKKKPGGIDVQNGGIPKKRDESINKQPKVTHKTDKKSRLYDTILRTLNHKEFKKACDFEGAEQKIKSKGDGESQQQKEAIQCDFGQSPSIDESQNFEEHHMPQSVGVKSGDFTTVNNQKFQTQEECKAKALNTPETVFQQPESIAHAGTENSHVPEKKPSEFKVNDPLTEKEVHLKQTLITSHLLLNTAEALFKLNIPISILSMNEHHIQEEKERKLVLDCSYEILQRKGRRQDLSKRGINPVRIRSLDDLVKQLYKDFEVLKCYDRKGRDKNDEADNLLKMLESDLNHSNPDANSMWDLGWNVKVLANIETDEVPREVETNLLEELIDEIAKDLLEGSI